MQLTSFHSWCLIALMAVLTACSDDDDIPPPITPEPEPEAAVHLDWASIPYDSLSTYGFFNGELSDMDPVAGVLPYMPINKLFTDFVHKNRFVWMPSTVSAEYVADGESLNFPDSTMLIKHFYYDDVMPSGDRKIIETRLMYKMDGDWHFANYLWNEQQTEATFDQQGKVVHVEWQEPGADLMAVDYRIPSASECLTCHKSYGSPIPIALKPQSLNSFYGYDDGVKNQLAKWEEMGYLAPGYPDNIETVVDWQDFSADLTERVRSYFDMNCAHCHTDGGHCDYRSLRLDYASTADPINMGVCVEPDEYIIGQSQLTYIIAAGNPMRSALLYRIESTEEEERMPLFGRTLINHDAVAMITEYIESLDTPCE